MLQDLHSRAFSQLVSHYDFYARTYNDMQCLHIAFLVSSFLNVHLMGRYRKRNIWKFFIS